MKENKRLVGLVLVAVIIALASLSNTASIQQSIVNLTENFTINVSGYPGQPGIVGNVTLVCAGNTTCTQDISNHSILITSSVGAGNGLTNESVDPFNMNAVNLTSGKIPYQRLNVSLCNPANQFSVFNQNTFNFDCVASGGADDDTAYLLISAYNGDFPNSTITANNLINWNNTFNQTYDNYQLAMNAMNQSNADNRTYAQQQSDNLNGTKLNKTSDSVIDADYCLYSFNNESNFCFNKIGFSNTSSIETKDSNGYGFIYTYLNAIYFQTKNIIRDTETLIRMGNGTDNIYSIVYDFNFSKYTELIQNKENLTFKVNGTNQLTINKTGLFGNIPELNNKLNISTYNGDFPNSSISNQNNFVNQTFVNNSNTSYLKNTTVFCDTNCTITKNPNGSINININITSSINATIPFSHVENLNTSRNVNTVYQNNHSVSMLVVASGNGVTGYQYFLMGSTNKTNITAALGYSSAASTFSVIVPSGWYYKVNVVSGDWSNAKYWVEVW